MLQRAYTTLEKYYLSNRSLSNHRLVIPLCVYFMVQRAAVVTYPHSSLPTNRRNRIDHSDKHWESLVCVDTKKSQEMFAKRS